MAPFTEMGRRGDGKFEVKVDSTVLFWPCKFEMPPRHLCRHESEVPERV